MLWKILEKESSRSSIGASYSFVRYFEGTEEDAQALIAPAPRLEAHLVGHDEIRAHYAGLKLDLYSQQRGRIEAILSQTTTKDLRDSILNAMRETEAEVKAIGERESAAVIANLSHEPRPPFALLSPAR